MAWDWTAGPSLPGPLAPLFSRPASRPEVRVLLYWPALLLAWGTEAETGEAWAAVCRSWERQRAVAYVDPGGPVYQMTELTPR